MLYPEDVFQMNRTMFGDEIPRRKPRPAIIDPSQEESAEENRLPPAVERAFDVLIGFSLSQVHSSSVAKGIYASIDTATLGRIQNRMLNAVLEETERKNPHGR